MKKLFAVTMVMFSLFLAANLSAGEYTGKAMKSKLATEDLEGDFMTVWSQKFSKEMNAWSDGKIDISVYPYGSLGDTRDINELCQLGVIDFVVTDYAWISSFVPEAQVLALHYIWPRENAPEILGWIVKNGQFMSVLEKAFRRNDLVPLGIIWEDWMWITSKKEISQMADMKGMKLRLMSSKVLVDQWKAYGASPTPMSFGEVYGGLQMGLIDAQMNPIFADYSMKFFEVTDFFTLTYAEAYLGIPTMNKANFDRLPDNAKAKMREFWAKATIDSAKWIEERNAADMEKIKKERPIIKFTELGDDKIAEFKAIAEANYEKFDAIGGPDAKLVRETLLKDIADAKKALGIE
ncbi:MAG: TRAP transporter substrate-binding protein DctP [Desulfobacterales bacterium]|nr:TRAP transporter substrate-binding protein DctP [Desulfobacterales bacterium]